VSAALVEQDLVVIEAPPGAARGRSGHERCSSGRRCGKDA
jgi:hypothetical protein